jgi:hypothetical protein
MAKEITKTIGQPVGVDVFIKATNVTYPFCYFFCHN